MITPSKEEAIDILRRAIINDELGHSRYCDVVVGDGDCGCYIAAIFALLN